MHKTSEDDLHRWASDELQDALLFGTPIAVLACLKRLDRLDGETFKIFVGQLDGTIPLKTYRNRFTIVGAKGKPPALASEPAARGFIAAEFARRLKASNRKNVVAEICKKWEIGKTVLEEILAEQKTLANPSKSDSA